MHRERRWFIGIVLGVVVSASLAAAASRLWHESPESAAKICFVR